MTRAKVIVKKPSADLWDVGEADYKVLLSVTADSGGVELFTGATAGATSTPTRPWPTSPRPGVGTGDTAVTR